MGYDKLSENSEMSDVALAQSLIRRAAEPIPAGEMIGAQVRRVARKLRWTPTRARAVWYGEARRIDAGELIELETAAGLRKARHAYQENARLLARLEALLAEEAPSGGRGVAAVLREVAGQVDRPRA